MELKRTQNTRRPLRVTPKRVWTFVGCLLIASFIAGDKGFYTQWKLGRERDRLQRQIEIQQAKCDSLRAEIIDLKNNPARMRLEARKNGMGAKDETIVLIREK
jgi:cell division protein FtsB